MQNNLTSKEYIKNLIIRSQKGEISQAESKEIEKVLTNLSKEEWKSLKIIGKEITKEQLDKVIDKAKEIPLEWKGEIKNFLHSLVNLGFALVNEDMIYQAVQLTKGRANNLTLSQQQQLGEEMATKVFIPQLIVQLDKISARKQARTVKDYHQAEVGFVKKAKQMISLVKKTKISEALGQKVNYKSLCLKALNILKNTTPDEIKVGKDRLKKYAGWLLELRARAEFKKHPELRQFAQTLMNFLDAIGDEELLQEWLNLGVEGAGNILRRMDENEKDWQKVSNVIISELQRPAIVSRGRNLLIKLTNHFNQLANEEVNNNLSPQTETDISQKIANIQSSGSQNDNNSPTGSQNTLNLLANVPNNLVNSVEGNGGSDNPQLSWKEFLKNVEKDLTTVQTPGKWYKNPWVIGFFSVGAFVVGGLVVWLLTRRKKEKVIMDNDESNF